MEPMLTVLKVPLKPTMPETRPEPTRLSVCSASLLALVTLCSACSNLVDIRPLATGRVDVSAYELRGADLTPLQREARRLCPQGGDILRQAGLDARPISEEGRIQRWMNATSEVLDPPKRLAQLVVMCKPVPDAASFAARPATAAADPVAAVSMPLGPISAEW